MFLGCHGRNRRALQDNLDRLTALWYELKLMCEEEDER